MLFRSCAYAGFERERDAIEAAQAIRRRIRAPAARSAGRILIGTSLPRWKAHASKLVFTKTPCPARSCTLRRTQNNQLYIPGRPADTLGSSCLTVARSAEMRRNAAGKTPAAFFVSGGVITGGPTNEAGLADPRGSVSRGGMPQFARSTEWLLER